jgi:hypothetical protein
MEIAGDPNCPLFSNAAKTFLHLSPGDDKWNHLVFESSRCLKLIYLAGQAVEIDDSSGSVIDP